MPNISVIYEFPGVFTQYHNNVDLNDPVINTEYLDNINKHWQNGNVSINQSDNVSARFTGYITPPTSDTYTIYYHHDNGGRFYFNEQIKIDHWVDDVSEQNFTVQMNTGQNYQIRVEHQDYGGYASADVFWSYR